MLALHLLQSSLVHINTLLLQQVLAEPGLGRGPGEGRLPGLEPVVLVQHQPLRVVPAGHGSAAGPGNSPTVTPGTRSSTSM